MNFDYLHEVETVVFRSIEPRPLKELVGVFSLQGFTQHDDVFSLDRKGKQPPWQHSSFVEVEVRYQGDEVFGFEEGVWDELRLNYLFAFLPFECAERFIGSVESTGRVLGITPMYQGLSVVSSQLRTEFERIRSGLVTETGCTPGSEELAILIQTTYPRRT